MAKKNSIIATAFANGVLTFTITGAGEIILPIAELSDDLRERAMLHGIVQKISDAAAMPKADLTGDAAKDALTKFEAMKSVADRLRDGDWSKRNGDGSGPVAGVIFRAFVEFVTNAAKAKKATVPTDEAIRAVYDAKTRAEQLALRNVPAIATIIERIKSERGAAVSVNTDDLLGELGI